MPWCRGKWVNVGQCFVSFESIYLSVRIYKSCRRHPETKSHSSLFLHWSGSKFLVVMAACTPSIHVFLGRPLFLLSRCIQYLLTPWCRVLLEQLTGLQKFSAFHRTRRFITALTSIRRLSLSWASPIQSIYPHPTSWKSILISTHLRLGLPMVSFPPASPLRSYTPPSPHPYAPHAQPISF